MGWKGSGTFNCREKFYWTSFVDWLKPRVKLGARLDCAVMQGNITQLSEMKNSVGHNN